MMKRGHLSYALFVIDYFDYLPRVTHLVSFYEGESGRADLRFKDLTQDGREEIIVVSEMKDFLNLFIFAKSPVQTYQEILNLPGLFLGTHIFANVKGDSKKEVEVHEKIRKGIIFPQDEGPYLTRKIIYMWNGEVYKDVHTEMVYDEGYALNKFFGALMLEENYDKAYRHISPEKFFRRLDRHNDQEALRHYFKRGDYNIFLASHPNINSLIGQIKLYRDLRFDNTEGWEEGGNAAPRSQSVRDDERYYKLIVGQASYSLVMRNRGRWRIEHFVKDDVRDGGWA
jgi:hypothetical protein